RRLLWVMQRTEFRSARSVDRLINTLDPASMCGIYARLLRGFLRFIGSFFAGILLFYASKSLTEAALRGLCLDALLIGMIAYRWKATRSPSSEILSWLLTRGELVLS